MGIRYVGLCQVVAVVKNDLVVVCSGYQVCVVIPSIAGKRMGIRYVEVY